MDVAGLCNLPSRRQAAEEKRQADLEESQRYLESVVFRSVFETTPYSNCAAATGGV
jgi:hypothetical protein